MVVDHPLRFIVALLREHLDLTEIEAVPGRGLSAADASCLATSSKTTSQGISSVYERSQSLRFGHTAGLKKPIF